MVGHILHSRHEKPAVLTSALPSQVMAIDTRDYYRDRIRKKTGYVERADFRVSEHDVSRHKHARAWRGNWIKLGIFLTIIGALILLKRYL